VETIEVDDWEYGIRDETVRTWSPDGRQVVRFMTMPATGIEVEIVVRGQEPLVVWVTDSSFGLPAIVDPLVEARPVDAVPIHRGDLTLIRRRSTI
jgi:hypothetical protein